MRKKKIIVSELNFIYKPQACTKWWLRNEKYAPLTDSVNDILRSIDLVDTPPDIKFYKSTARKAVFQLDTELVKNKSVVVKVFFLNRISHRLRSHLYALDEAANLIHANNEGIGTPQVYGYGHLYDGFGLVKTGIIILESLIGSTASDLLSKAASPEEKCDIFMQTLPLFNSLYNAGCNHIDINSHGVIINTSGGATYCNLIDFQHARFHGNPSKEMLMFQAGYFARDCRKWLDDDHISDWLSRIFDFVGITEENQKKKMQERFEYYYFSKGLSPTQSSLSRKQRRNIR